MPYAAKQDLIDRFGQQELIDLTDRATPQTGAIDDTVLARALADADAEINGYLASRYTLPLASTPDSVKMMACNIARYYLYEDRATEQVRVRYEDAIKFLKSVASGTCTLGLDPASAPVATDGGALAAGVDRIFDRDTLSDYA